MEAGGLDEIRSRVEAASKKYEFFRRHRDDALVRQGRAIGGEIERLVNGRWVRAWYWHSLGASGRWECLSESDLRKHVRRHLIRGLRGPRLRWRREPRQRFYRTAFWRWLVPPLRGGASRRVAQEAVKRSRNAYTEMLARTSGEDLAALTEQASVGYEHQRGRGASAEQRANFFLGASGLTTSLVLANAGLLLGSSKLDPPWRELAAVALGLASVFAIVAGMRAMQATMITFVRTPPSTVTGVVERRKLKGDELGRAYVVALLVAQARTGVINDWKVKRLAAARRWFVGTIAGVVALTVLVLAAALA